MLLTRRPTLANPATTERDLMPMIPARPGYEAIFGELDDEGVFAFHDSMEVIAWDADDGCPYVIPSARYRRSSKARVDVPDTRPEARGLRRADQWRNFSHVESAEPEDTFTAIASAGGWRVAWPAEDGDPETSEPLAAWALTPDGTVVALSVDGDGLVGAVKYTSSARVFHPDAA